MSRRTFQHNGPTSQRFWNIEVQGNTYVVSFGKAGSKGQTQRKTFPDAARAQAAAEKLIKEKLSKGYRETTAAAAAAGPSLRQALEAALVENPDEVANHAAYADYLTEQGDPRGEFIQVQLALEAEQRPAAQRKRLQQREQELLQAHQREWLGELAPYFLDGAGVSPYLELYGLSGPGQYRFARGWLSQLHLTCLTVSLARILIRARQTRLLRELLVETVSDGSSGYGESRAEFPDDVHSIGLSPLVESPYLTNVRVLRLGTDDGDDWQGYRCYLHTPVIVDLVRKMPRVEELYLFANGFDVNELFALPTLTSLRVLQLYHSEQVHRLQLLAENRALVNLTHLLIHPHHLAWWGAQATDDSAAGYQEAEGYLPLAVVRPLLQTPNLPRLTHLRLRVSSLGNDGCTEIVASGILRRLKSLDLRHGRITEKGARALAACPDLRRLEWLDLDRNSINAAGIVAVKAVGVPVRIDDQHSEEEVLDEQGEELWDEEAEYLREGEFE
jgi:uncharacterized protein (TIGR02996 family)